MNSAATSSPGEGVYLPLSTSEARKDKSPFKFAGVMEFRTLRRLGEIVVCTVEELSGKHEQKRTAAQLKRIRMKGNQEYSEEEQNRSAVTQVQ